MPVTKRYSVDKEWIPYKGKYSQKKAKILEFMIICHGDEKLVLIFADIKENIL